MKYSVIFFLFVCQFSSFGQMENILRIDSVPSKGVLLDNDWKWNKGDNYDWAKPGFDDSNWESIDPTLDLYYLSQIKRERISWLRIRLHIDSSLLNKPLAFQIYQSIASEIYLNGKLLATFGTLGTKNKKTQAYRAGSNPLSLIFQQSEQVMAVRFSVQRGLPMIGTTHPYYAYRFRILDINYAAEFREVSHLYPLLNAFWAAIFLTLALIHLGIFLRFRNRKADLFFSCAMLSMTIANLLFIILGEGGHSLSFMAYGFLIDWILLFPVYNLFLYLAIRVLFPLKNKFLHGSALAVILMSIIIFFYSYEYGQFIGIYIGFLFTITLSVVLSWRALQKGRKEALVIVIGFSIYLIISLCFLLFYSGLISDIEFGVYREFSVMDLLYAILSLSVPFSLSLFLARDFASTSFKLQKKLEEVQFLSEKTISQEKEKQEILSSQKEMLEKQVTERTAELKQSLQELKSTQSQLIQSEKMASLGELTAGIAHEIQNPLNFVNNFSEVNQELIEELKSEKSKVRSERDEQLEIDILNDIAANEEKINYHGKRADAIVKGMLQHSKASTGKKELTDINKLADEYLRLAYHGLRAKDKSFNADFKTDFDDSIDKINIIPQDIGRVLLNLYNNAFYATNEKRTAHRSSLTTDYKPLVSVQTKKVNDKVEIKVSDNGNGISQNIVDKIFQPFFTTKPTGQGTGLGLSLSYDIIKAHGGEIKVETKQEEFTEFIIQLPLI